MGTLGYFNGVSLRLYEYQRALSGYLLFVYSYLLTAAEDAVIEVASVLESQQPSAAVPPCPFTLLSKVG